MNYLFYHTHVPVSLKNGQLFAPRFLANEVNTFINRNINIYLIVYEALESEVILCQSSIDLKTSFLLLGSHNTVPRRLLRSPVDVFKIWKLLKTYKSSSLLIKGPTPLLLSVFPLQYISNTFIFLVGDYTLNLTTLNFYYFKNQAIKFLSYLVDFSIKHLYPKASLIVNSQVLLEKYSPFYQNTKLVRTSTIFSKDILIDKLYVKRKFRILFVGRVDYSKGIYELVKAFRVCFNLGIAQKLTIVGKVIINGIDVKSKVERDFGHFDFFKYIDFAGPVYDESQLREIYLNSDLFVLPSKSEGFPRVFWEAFACGLPVITTKVGGIPYVLQNYRNALFIDKGESTEIIETIKKLFSDDSLYCSLVKNSRELAFSSTVEVQIENVVNFIYEK